TIRLANPAFGTFLNAREVLAMAADAKRMPAREAEYRNLILNQRVEPTNMFVSPGVWKACGTPVGSLAGLTLYGGLEFFLVAVLTALVLVGRSESRWHVEPTILQPAGRLSQKTQTHSATTK